MLTIARSAWLVLVYNLGVIAWGAYVRATGSGAGCGAHWPLCDGRIIPRSLGVATLIEYSHRITSGLALLSVLALLWWVRKSTPQGHPARLGALMTVVFMLTEAAVGAGLVLFELVADNASMARALFMAVHLTNTFVLIAWLALTAWWLSGGEAMTPAATPGRTAALFGLLGAVIVVGVSGAIAALGDTLFPSKTLAEALAADLSPTSHMLLRLRMLHPALAIGTAGLLAVAAPDGTSRRHAAGRATGARRGRARDDSTAGWPDQCAVAGASVDTVATSAARRHAVDHARAAWRGAAAALGAAGTGARGRRRASRLT